MKDVALVMAEDLEMKVFALMESFEVVVDAAKMWLVMVDAATWRLVMDDAVTWWLVMVVAAT